MSTNQLTAHPFRCLDLAAMGETVPAGEPLVWTSTETGALLLDGRAMTQQRAIHACLTHSRNQIDPNATTPTRIVYRTLTGDIHTYAGTRPTPPLGDPPMDADQLAARRAARIEDLEYMAGTGETVPGAAARLRLHPDTLRKFLSDQDRMDLFGWLLANQDDRPYAGPNAVIRHTGRQAA
jgi:hypothetical protein